jgi:hypothetical protein
VFCDVKCVTLIADFKYNVKSDEDLQVGLRELRRYSISDLKQKFNEVGLPDLYSSLPTDRLEKCIKFAYLVCVCV